MVLKIKDINLNKLQFIFAKTNKNYNIYKIEYMDTELVFQTEKMKYSNDVRPTENTSAYADLYVYLTEQNELNLFFYALEDKIIDMANEHPEWFNDNDNLNFKSIIRKNQTTEYIKLKLVKNETYETKIYRKKNSSIVEYPFSEFVKNKYNDKYVRLVLEVFGICIQDNHLSLIVILHKILLQPDEKKNYDFDLSDDEKKNKQEYIQDFIDTNTDIKPKKINKYIEDENSTENPLSEEKNK